jgi:hypothetical protein
MTTSSCVQRQCTRIAAAPVPEASLADATRLMRDRHVGMSWCASPSDSLESSG